MTRLADVKAEERETKRRDQLVLVLEYGLVGALQAQGVEMLGFSFKYDAFHCLMTIRAEIAGNRRITHVGSDSIINCFLQAYSVAQHGRLQWQADQYHPDGV